MKKTKELAVAVKKRVRASAEAVENKLLVEEGKRSIARKKRIVTRVAKKAAKVGLVVGTLAAVAVVVRDVRKRRKMDA